MMSNDQDRKAEDATLLELVEKQQAQIEKQQAQNKDLSGQLFHALNRTQEPEAHSKATRSRRAKIIRWLGLGLVILGVVVVALLVNTLRDQAVPPVSPGYAEALRRIATAGDGSENVGCTSGSRPCLRLSGLGLTQLPPGIGQLTQLELLVLSDNQLTTLPPEIGQLTNLTDLRIHNNQLTALPPEIGWLTNLQHLYLNDNQLTTVPPELFQLTTLQALGLGENKLTTLPPEIERLPKLSSLEVFRNPLNAASRGLLQRLEARGVTVHGP